MNKRTIVFCIVLLVILATSLVFPSPISCADCNEGGSVDKQCGAESNAAYDSCCELWGCHTLGTLSYCVGEGRDAYNGCVTLHGCPNLAY